MCTLLAQHHIGKTIQVISFLSAIMKKTGDKRDIDRRRKHVSRIQDTSKDWKKRRVLPPANATWPTCLIIAPSSVVGNWEREFETVRAILWIISPTLTVAQWGYFEVGMYVGGKNERSEVLHDFKLGRLDVRKCLHNLWPAVTAQSYTPVSSCNLIRNCAK